MYAIVFFDFRHFNYADSTVDTFSMTFPIISVQYFDVDLLVSGIRCDVKTRPKVIDATLGGLVR